MFLVQQCPKYKTQKYTEMHRKFGNSNLDSVKMDVSHTQRHGNDGAVVAHRDFLASYYASSCCATFG